MKTSYFQLSFSYSGPVVNMLDDDEESVDASKANTAANKNAVIVLDRLKQDGKIIEHKHAYSWPDGSLYRFVSAPDTLDDSALHSLVSKTIQTCRFQDDLRIMRVYCEKPDKDPNKVSYKTLAEYMEKR